MDKSLRVAVTSSDYVDGKEFKVSSDAFRYYGEELQNAEEEIKNYLKDASVSYRLEIRFERIDLDKRKNVGCYAEYWDDNRKDATEKIIDSLREMIKL